jgi:SAM-dependent methyltransferase
VPRDFDETNVNRQYFLWYVNSLGNPGARVLDFGCGSGKVVRILRRAGYDAMGVDVRWPGADFYGDIEHSDLPAGRFATTSGAVRCHSPTTHST